MKALARDIGSSFYQLQKGDWEMDVLLKHKEKIELPFTYYYSGRNAMLAILKKITSQKTINVIWLPSYYCDTVVDLISTNFNNVQYYNVSPFDFEEMINISSFGKKNDLVILNNFWGLSTFQYPSIEDRPLIIEDHSHGWLSKQSKESKADYCICSLRKTYPIPLGAVVWEPNSTKTFNYYQNITDFAIKKAYSAMYESMLQKRQFIKENLEHLKNDYLKLLDSGENQLNYSNHYVRPEKELVEHIKSFMELSPNHIKDKNLKFILNHIDCSKHFKIITRDGFTPFGLLLVFSNEKMFNSFKDWSVSKGIYPAHLWPNTKLDSKWKFLLNLHIDFRYNTEDMSYLVEKINVWSKNNV